MNYEPFRSEGRISSNLSHNKIVKSRDKAKHTKLEIPHTIDQSVDHHITSLHQSLWFEDKYFYWSYFKQGIFWGVIVSCTAILSAGCGAALTRIDVVEQVIAQKIKANFSFSQSSEQSGLQRPLNILMIKVASKPISGVELVKSSVGESQTILLLRFDPQTSLVKVINIPTDSRVNIPGFGWGTIADAHKYGGTALVSQMVEQLIDGISIDRYLRATSETFQELTASGKLTFTNCNIAIQNCLNPSKQLTRQEKNFEAIRQRLNIPAYLDKFEATVTRLKPDLDSNISVTEFMAVANFVKELERDGLKVDLLPGYMPGKAIALDNQVSNPSLKASSYAAEQSAHAVAPQQLEQNFMSSGFSGQTNPGQNSLIAVQNTTDNPELAMKVVHYLRRQNFTNVYLVEHIPLKLSKTKILVNSRQQKLAKQVQSILSFGALEPTFGNTQEKLLIQIGKDAQYLPLDTRL